MCIRDSIKPVISVTDGEIHLLGKARGSKMGNNLLVQEINEAGGIDFSKPVLPVSYTHLDVYKRQMLYLQNG